MIYAGIESIKNTYRDILQERGDFTAAAELNKKDFKDPVFDGYSVHPEEEPSTEDINQAFQQIGIDLAALDAQFASSAELYQDLMEDILSNLEAVDDIIAVEKERIQDINIITGQLSDFTTVKTLTSSDFTGTASAIDEYTYATAATTRNSVALEIDDVTGNGYEGNDYVYNNGVFEKDAMDTSNRDFIIDNSTMSYYEYSRITMAEKQAYYPPVINFDTKEAECTITLYSETIFNTIKILSSIDTMEVVQVSTSADGGVTFNDSMKKPIQINNREEKYDDSDYIYGAGIICFPRTQYLKVRLKSNSATNDTLAFQKLLLEEANLLINISFDPSAYITQFLVPVFTQGLLNNEDAQVIPLSIILAIALTRTGFKPFNAGHFNFWALPYMENISPEASDNGYSAFSTWLEGIEGIIAYCLNDEEAQQALGSLVLEERVVPEEPMPTTTQAQYNDNTDPNPYKYTKHDEDTDETFIYFYDEELSMNYRYISGIKWHYFYNPIDETMYWYDSSSGIWHYTISEGTSKRIEYYYDSELLNERFFYEPMTKLFYTMDDNNNKLYFTYNTETGMKIYHINDKLYLYNSYTGTFEHYDPATELCYQMGAPKTNGTTTSNTESTTETAVTDNTTITTVTTTDSSTDTPLVDGLSILNGTDSDSVTTTSSNDVDNSTTDEDSDTNNTDNSDQNSPSSDDTDTKTYFWAVTETTSKKTKDPITLYKQFISTLTRSTADVQANETCVALNNAVRNISEFDSWEAVLESFVADFSEYGTDQYHKFLQDCCDIKLDNADVGTLMGKDASNLPTVSILNVMHETGGLPTLLDNKFSIKDLSVTLPKMITPLEKFLGNALYTWWIKGALNIAEEYLGLTFGEYRTTANHLRVEFVNAPDVEEVVRCTVDSTYNKYQGYTSADHQSVKALLLYLNLAHMTEHYDLHNPNFMTKHGPLDVLILHELVKGILAANVHGFVHYPLAFIKGGSAALLSGIEFFFGKEMSSIDTLDLEDPLITGYLLMRYLLKQASRDRDPSKSVSTIKDTLTQTKYYYDPDAEQFYKIVNNKRTYVEEMYGNELGLAHAFFNKERTTEQALQALLNLLGANQSQVTEALEYIETYQLEQYDSLESSTDVSEKYESYFMRRDQWVSTYNEEIANANQLIQLPTARRHVIRINDLIGFANEYSASSYLQTGELLQGDVDCIAIFANEYLPPTFPPDITTYNTGPYITYVLTVNGTDYEIVPVNSHKAGIKIIRHSNYSIVDDYTVRITEPIKSATLTIKLITPDQSYSPYVSNVKVCVGKAMTK